MRYFEKQSIKKHLFDGWHVYSESGKHFGGPYSSERQANKRLAQMEMFKHMKKSAGKLPPLFVGVQGEILKNTPDKMIPIFSKVDDIGPKITESISPILKKNPEVLRSKHTLARYTPNSARINLVKDVLGKGRLN